MQQNGQGQSGANGPGTPSNNGSPALPANGNGGQFPMSNQSRVSANLHIPASKQRNLLPNQQGVVGGPNGNGSPARISSQMNTPQQAALLSMVNSGYKIQPGNTGVGGPAGVNRQIQGGMQGSQGGFNVDLQQQISQMDPKTLRPELLIATIHPNAPRQRAPSAAARRDSEMHIASAANYGLQPDKSESLLAKVTWTPDATYDSALREKLWEFQSPVKASGRATLMQGFSQGRVLSDVPLEKVPDAIRAIAEEADRESMALKKKEVDPALPSAKKRKVQDVADSVDKGLIITEEVENVSL